VICSFEKARIMMEKGEKMTFVGQKYDPDRPSTHKDIYYIQDGVLWLKSENLRTPVYFNTRFIDGVWKTSQN
jgi:hypothetical protein